MRVTARLHRPSARERLQCAERSGRPPVSLDPGAAHVNRRRAGSARRRSRREDRTTLAVVEPREQALRLYGAVSDRGPLAWSWVEEQLGAAGTYWVVARTPGHPRPRPVWGVWHARHLHLSVGSPGLLRALAQDPAVTVHLDSGTDVVIVEGTTGRDPDERCPPAVIEAYNIKYDWDYQVAQSGPLVVIRPQQVLGWRSAGWSGREGFQVTGRWTFDSPQ